MGLAWDPVVELENPKRETIVPYHQLVDATLESSGRAQRRTGLNSSGAVSLIVWNQAAPNQLITISGIDNE